MDTVPTKHPAIAALHAARPGDRDQARNMLGTWARRGTLTSADVEHVIDAYFAAQVVVTFRDYDQPRALASRFIAVAHRHARGWSLSLAEGAGRWELITFDSVVEHVIVATGTRRLLIVWPLNTASSSGGAT